eukprot:scaffold89391_cov67-Attheya_sp.AAC.1
MRRPPNNLPEQQQPQQPWDPVKTTTLCSTSTRLRQQPRYILKESCAQSSARKLLTEKLMKTCGKEIPDKARYKLTTHVLEESDEKDGGDNEEEELGDEHLGL